MSDGDAMGPNLLPDWTEEELQLLTEKLSEEVKKEGDRIFSGMMTNCVPNSSTLSITLKDLIDMKEKIDKQFPEPKGVHITSIIPPDHGWPIVSHCDIWKKTVILLSPYASQTFRWRLLPIEWNLFGRGESHQAQYVSADVVSVEGGKNKIPTS